MKDVYKPNSRMIYLSSLKRNYLDQQNRILYKNVRKNYKIITIL